MGQPRKQPKSKHEPFESFSSDNKFVRLFNGMLTNECVLNLPTTAFRLYTYMKLQFSNQQIVSGYDKRCFYFPQGLWKDTYKLYTNGKQFSRDLHRLVDAGLIEIVLSGKNTRTPSIYRFSDKWKGV